MATKFKKYVIRPVRDSFLYLLLQTALYVIAPISNRKLLLWWHGVCAHIVFKISKKSRLISQANLRLVYGEEKSPGEYEKICRSMFVQLSKTFTDYICFAFKKRRNQFSRYFKFEGEENLRAAYDKGKGVLCIVPHTPGWEFSAIMPPILGFPTLGVSSRIKNPALHKTMVSLRESRGMKDIIRERCYDTLVSELKKGKCLIIMIDQDTMNVRGEFLDFMGHRAYTPIGCARLARDTGAAMVPVYTIRHSETDTYTFRMLPEIPFEERESDLETFRYNTQKCNNVMERIIRENPDQWVWFHERWKTTPEMLQAFLEKKRRS